MRRYSQCREPAVGTRALSFSLGVSPPLSTLSALMEEYKVLRAIGKGSFGKVRVHAWAGACAGASAVAGAHCRVRRGAASRGHR